MNAPDAVAATSLLVGCVALGVGFYAVNRANKTTSAATMVTLNEGFRTAWGRFLSASEQQKTTELADLLNLFEIACAVWQEGSVSGLGRTAAGIPYQRSASVDSRRGPIGCSYATAPGQDHVQIY